MAVGADGASVGRLAALAINEQGFVFDPRSGDSFTVNPCGRRIIRGLVDGQEGEALAAGLVRDFGLELAQARADVRDFVDQLRALGLVDQAFLRGAW